MWKCKSPGINKTILKKNIKFEGLMLPEFKTYCKHKVIKTVKYWHKYRQLDKWN